MTYRVVQWSTGNVGKAALRAITEHPEMELVGVHAHGADKIGKDAAEFCGLPEPTGILATDDIDALLDLNADCVVYTTLMPNIDIMCRILERGTNIVGTAAFITGAHLGPNSRQRLHAAGLKGEASVHGTGVNPGYTGLLAVATSGLCDRIHSISVTESVDVTDYASKETWEALGWAKPPGTQGVVDLSEIRTREIREALEMVAEALGIELDDVTFDVEFSITPNEIVLPYMTYPAGTIAGQVSTYHGMRNGRSVIRQNIAYSVRGKLDPPIEVIEGHRIDIVGEPSLRVDLTWPRTKIPGVNRSRSLMDGAMVATAMAAVNAVPVVCAAPPGVRLAFELPPTPARGLVIDT